MPHSCSGNQAASSKEFSSDRLLPSPSGYAENFLDSLDSVITSIQRNNVVVTGDFTAKHSSWYANQSTDDMDMAVKSFMDGHDLLQLISSPTYIVNTSKPVLLDLIFIARPLAPSVVSTTALPPVADHCAIMVSLSIKKIPALKP